MKAPNSSGRAGGNRKQRGFRALTFCAFGVKEMEMPGTMSTLNAQEVAAFVGEKAGYYLQKWRPVLDGTGNAGNATGFNWAAFFLSGLWLPYRKMYRATAIFFGVILLETLFEEIIYVGILGKPEAPGF
jgi:hypothetical protein